MLGNYLYPLVQDMGPRDIQTGKIVGMLLQEENLDLLAILDNVDRDRLLQAKVDEAVTVIRGGGEADEHVAAAASAADSGRPSAS